MHICTLKGFPLVIFLVYLKISKDYIHVNKSLFNKHSQNQERLKKEFPSFPPKVINK